MIDMLTTETAIYFIVLTVLFGLAVGSFLNVCIYRIPRKESIAFPGSHCPNCNNAIKWYDNIPVLSYLILKGKCRHCKAKISARYPFIELLNAFIWVVIAFRINNFIGVMLGFIFSSVLTVVSAIDIENRIIPNSTCVVILSLAVIKILFEIIRGISVLKVLSDTAIGALSGSFLLFLLYLIISKLKKKEALGGGDVKLAFAAGAFLGWKQTLFGIALSAYIGLIILIVLAVAKKRNLREAFPYGPFLSLGFLISYLWAEDIFSWYLQTFI